MKWQACGRFSSPKRCVAKTDGARKFTVEADGSYGLGSGFFYSVPVTCSGGGPVLRVGGIPITTELASAMEAQRVALSK